MRRAAISFLALLAVILATGCGGGGGSKSGNGSTGSAGTGSGGGGFEVVRCTPTQGSQPAIPTQIRLVMSQSIDSSTVIFDASGASVSTIVFVAQAPGAGTASLLPGTITVSGTEIVYVPQAAFAAGTAYGVALSSSILDTSGAALTSGSVGGPITLSIPGIIFQAAFTPAASGGTTGGGSGTGGGATPAALLSGFVFETGSDPWFIDFAVTGLFDDDVRAHGLATTDVTLGAWAQARVEQRIFSYTGTKYLRNPDGTGVVGASYAISFLSTAPGGSPGVDYSRHCVGGDDGQGGNTLGISFYDPGNLHKEDNSPANQCGIYSASIDGTASNMRPAITTAEVKFVDGTYVLGQGTAADDARFLAIQTSLTDYGTAIGCVLAHEVGHSVGLDHDSAGPTSIMQAALSSQMLSNLNMAFSSVSRPLLDHNLGFTK